MNNYVKVVFIVMKVNVYYSLFSFIQLCEDYDCPAGPHPDRGEREETAQTAGAAGRRRMRTRWRDTKVLSL